MKIFNKNYRYYLALRFRYLLGCKKAKQRAEYECKLFIKLLANLKDRIDLLPLATDIIYLDERFYVITPRIGKFLGRSHTLRNELEHKLERRIIFVKDDFSFNYIKSKVLSND